MDDMPPERLWVLWKVSSDSYKPNRNGHRVGHPESFHSRYNSDRSSGRSSADPNALLWESHGSLPSLLSSKNVERLTGGGSQENPPTCRAGLLLSDTIADGVANSVSRLGQTTVILVD